MELTKVDTTMDDFLWTIFGIVFMIGPVGWAFIYAIYAIDSGKDMGSSPDADRAYRIEQLKQARYMRERYDRK